MDPKIVHGSLSAKVTDVYARAPSLFKDRGLLVNCLDSNHAPAKLGKWLTDLGANRVAWKKVGQAVWIEAASVPSVFQDGKTFFGFDEIYLLALPPQEGDVPEESFSIAVHSFDRNLPEAFSRVFKRLNAQGYLSDGTGFGLNFAFASKEDGATLVAKLR